MSLRDCGREFYTSGAALEFNMKQKLTKLAIINVTV